MPRSQHSLAEDLTEAVKTRFHDEITAKHSRVGGRTFLPRDENWDWQSVAKYILKHNLPYAEWVHFVVNHMAVPRPSHLKSDELQRQFRETRNNRHKHAKNTIRIQLASDQARVEGALYRMIESVELGEVEMEREQIIQYVALSRTTDLCPLFRYCWLRSEEIEPGEDLFAEAMNQYAVYPELYDSVWGALIPADFREQAKAYGR